MSDVTTFQAALPPVRWSRGGPETGRIERVLVNGGEGGTEADAAGYSGHHGQRWNGIVLGGLGGIPKLGLQGLLVGVGDVVKVGEEYRVERAPLTNLGDVLVGVGPAPTVIRLW